MYGAMGGARAIVLPLPYCIYTKRHVVADTNRNENDLSVWLRCRVPIRRIVTSAVCPMGRPPNPKDLSPCQPAPLGSSRATAFGRRDQPEHAGDAGKVKKGKDTILYGLIGLVVCVLAFALVNWVIVGILKQQ